jgi:ribokinase
LIPNEVEFKQFTGSTPESFNLEKFREGKNSVITVGSAGAILISDSGIITRIPTELVNAVDTTGAGDCFIGSFSYALGCGLDPASAAQFACRIASISVTRKGAQSSYPSAAEISTLS